MCEIKYEPLLGYNDIVSILIEHGAKISGDLWSTTEANKVGSSTTETEEHNTPEVDSTDYYDLFDDGDSTDYDNL